MSPIKFCRTLVERIVQASTYTHQPPSFVHSDWRFAEFPVYILILFRYNLFGVVVSVLDFLRNRGKFEDNDD